MSDLESIFRCDDQSALIHNYVANQDPPPGAWSHQSEPQSALGRISFPEVLTISRGEVFTRDARKGRAKVVEQLLDHHMWLPWAYDGENDSIRVSRSVGRDVWLGRVELKRKSQSGLLLMECVPAANLKITHEQTKWGMRFAWDDRFEIHLRFSGKGVKRVDVADDPSTLRRMFAGFEDVVLNKNHLSWVWSALRRCWIGVQFSGAIDVAFAVARPGKVKSSGLTTRSIRAAEKRRWETFFRDLVPPLKTKDPVLRDTYFFAWQTLWANRAIGGSGSLPKPFTSPARLHYGSQWWWDEAFHSAIFRHLTDPKICYEFLENFRIKQRDDGLINGCLQFTVDERSNTGANTSQAIMPMQPPVISFILQLMRDKPGWPARDELASLYDMLHRHAKWHDLPSRDTDQDGLVEFHHCFESSTDQSQRWDSQKIIESDVISALRPTEAIDTNVWTSVLWDVLGDMAEQLGDTDAAGAHRARAARMMALIEEHMWDESDGLYYDIDGKTHRKIKVKTPFSFMPMLSRHARRDRCERMVREHLTNPRAFWTRFPLCSVSLDTPGFNPIDMWRGPTWINLNWMVIEGLSRQGFDDVAQKLARKTVELVGPRYRNGKRVRSPRVWEWYQPHTGEALGNNQYSWSALVIDLIVRFLS